MDSLALLVLFTVMILILFLAILFQFVNQRGLALVLLFVLLVMCVVAWVKLEPQWSSYEKVQQIVSYARVGGGTGYGWTAPDPSAVTHPPGHIGGNESVRNNGDFVRPSNESALSGGSSWSFPSFRWPWTTPPQAASTESALSRDIQETSHGVPLQNDSPLVGGSLSIGHPTPMMESNGRFTWIPQMPSLSVFRPV